MRKAAFVAISALSVNNAKIGQSTKAYYLNIFCFTIYGHGGHFGQVT